MFKSSLFFLLFAFVTKGICAQTVEFIEPRNVQSVQDAEFSVFHVSDHLYILQKKYRMNSPVSFDLQLDVYNAARKPVASHIIDKTLEMGDANIYKGIFPVKERLVMFKAEYSKATGSKLYSLYYYPFDLQGKRQKKTPLVSIAAESAFNSGNFVVGVSPDGTRVAVIAEQPHTKDGFEKCEVTVYDNNFTQRWKKVYEFPYESSKAPMNDIFVNNEGVAFVFKRIKAKKQFDKFSVFSFTENGRTVTENKIELGNAFNISTYRHLFNASGDLIMAGYYYTDKNVGINVETPDGPFYLRVNASGKLAAARANTVKPQKQNLVTVQVVPVNGNGNEVFLLGEQQFKTSSPIPGKMMEYYYEYLTGDISVGRLSAEGDVMWEYKVEKELKSANDGGRFLSSYMWQEGSELHLLFPDLLYKRDEKKQVVVGPGTSGQRVDVIETIGPDGKLIRATYVKDMRIGGRHGEYMFIPVTASRLGNSLFLLSARGAELVGTKLTL
jgi:hypothetical protein